MSSPSQGTDSPCGVDRASNPATVSLLESLLAVWPENARFLQKSFADRSEEALQSTEIISEKILQLAQSNVQGFCADYRWTCDRLLEEELHFRRNETYRFSSLSEVADHIYHDDSYMRPYLNGLLLSQVFWSNHAHVFDYYLRQYLPRIRRGGSHLEVGPGHGLFLYFASQSPNIDAVTGWDISSTAIENTQGALGLLQADASISLAQVDVMAPPVDAGSFDSIVMSEVLEHIEDPHAVLASIRKQLAPGGFLFINVPVNSPAPDHIYLLRTPEESLSLVSNAGLKVVESAFFPASGATLEKALRNDLTISCVIVAQA